MNRQLVSKIEELHFFPSEAKVYVALAEIGQTSAGEIIRRTKLHRSVVYESLDKLITRKLVFKLTKKNIAYFQLTDPEQLITDARHQLTIAEELVPELKEAASAGLPEITVYEGLESYRRFWLDSTARLPVGTIDYVAGSIGEAWFELMQPVAKKYLDLRLKRKIKWKMIVFHQADIELELLKNYPKLHEYRWIDRPNPRFGNFNVYENTSVILHSATEPMIIEVKNPSLVKVFQNIFNILWDSGIPKTGSKNSPN